MGWVISQISNFTEWPQIGHQDLYETSRQKYIKHTAYAYVLQSKIFVCSCELVSKEYTEWSQNDSQESN